MNDQVQELAAEGVYGTCSWCGTAFSSVLEANLTQFKSKLKFKLEFMIKIQFQILTPIQISS